jgi:hypothetical protein
MEVRRAPLSSSIRERIKLNKKLTVSAKTGELIGVSKKKVPPHGIILSST